MTASTSPAAAAGNPFDRGIRAVDRFQQRHPVASGAGGGGAEVGDDQGGTLVTSLAYSAFVAGFPLLLVTVLGFVLGHNDDARDLGLGGGQHDDREPAELGVALDIGHAARAG